MKNISTLLRLTLSVSCLCLPASAFTGITDATELHNGTLPRHLRGKDEVKDTKDSDGQLPTVFIIGAQKGGSLSLFDLMIQHPLLCGAKHREPHYFSLDENYNLGTKHYKSLFKETKCSKDLKNSKYIDGTPMLHNSKSWDRIVETYKKEGKKKDNLKFIVLLREPISRDFVWYQHIIRNDLHRGELFTNIKTLDEMNYETNFTSRTGEDTRYGRYIDQIQEFLKYFRRDQLLVLSSQAIFDDATNIMKKVYRFIDVPEVKEASIILPRPNHFLETGLAFETCAIHHIPDMDCSYRDLMGKYYDPYNQKLYAWLKTTKNEANANEPNFNPVFQDYKSIECNNNARKDYDEFLSKEQDTIKLRLEFQTKTNGFHMPEGACHVPPHGTKADE